MNIGICDDNELHLNFIADIVQKHFSISKDILVETLKPEQLADRINEMSCPYDILITDIDLGLYHGVELAKGIQKINPACIIIFISNYLNLATEVYEVPHIYFVLKTDAAYRLPTALEKAMTVMDDRRNNVITLHYQNVDTFLPLKEITYIEAYGRYLHFHDLQQSYKCIQTLRTISKELTPSFYQCHKSYIVNMDYIRSISRMKCLLSTGIEIPISQTYSKSFQSAYISHVSKKLLSI